MFETTNQKWYKESVLQSKTYVWMSSVLIVLFYNYI